MSVSDMHIDGRSLHYQSITSAIVAKFIFSTIYNGSWQLTTDS